jgi:hypothetical protein
VSTTRYAIVIGKISAMVGSIAAAVNRKKGRRVGREAAFSG